MQKSILRTLLAVLATFSLCVEYLGAPSVKEDPARYGVVPFFQNFNNRLARFELLEKRGINSGFSVILVRATPPSDPMGRISGSSLDFNDEAFGVFIVSDKIGKSILTLDIFPTERMWDYEIGIEKISENFLLLWRKGATYGDVTDKVKYFFDLSEKISSLRSGNTMGLSL